MDAETTGGNPGTDGQTMANIHRRLQNNLEMGISQLLLDPSVWQPYGLRRGGACEDWATHGDAGRLCMRGRWSQIKTAKIYAVEALLIREASTMSEPHKDRVAYWEKQCAIQLRLWNYPG